MNASKGSRRPLLVERPGRSRQLSAIATAQGAVALAPSGQPALAGIRPTLRNTAPLLFPGYGLPGLLAMPNVVVAVHTGVAGTLGNPAYSPPLPPGLGPRGLALSTQFAVFVPGGLGLTGATGIVI